MKFTKTAIATILATAISSGAYAADLVEPEKTYFEEVVVGELHAIQDTKQVYIAPLVSENVEIEEPRADIRNRPGQEWVLEPEEHAGIQEMYLQAMERRFSNENFVIVEQPGADTLVIRAELTELEPLAPKDDRHNRYPSDTYYTEGAGDAEITIAVTLNGETILEATDERHMGNRWQENDRFHNKVEFRRLMSRWANALMNQLDA